jgi:hypothetical protein
VKAPQIEFTIFTAEGVSFTDHPDLQAGLPQQRQKLTVAEVAAYLCCGEDHVYRLVKAGELLKATENPIRVDRQSAIDFRSRRQLGFDPESFVPSTQRNYRADQVAKLFSCSVNHVVKLIKQREIILPEESIASAPSGPSILVPRESIVDFVRRRTYGSAWWKKNHGKKKHKR